MPEPDLLLHLPPLWKATSPEVGRPHQNEPGLLLSAAILSPYTLHENSAAPNTGVGRLAGGYWGILNSLVIRKDQVSLPLYRERRGRRSP